MTDLHVTTWGDGDRVVLLHGSGGWGEESFAEQRPLADAFRLDLVDRRGFGDSPPAARVDWAVDADDLTRLLDAPAHLVGHSYGAIACLLTAARIPERVRSLTLIEPSTYAIAREHPAVRALFTRMAPVYAAATTLTPGQYVAACAGAFGFAELDGLPDLPLSGRLLAATRASRDERPPWDAAIPLAAIAAQRIPTLLVVGAWTARPPRPGSISAPRWAPSAM